MGLKKGMTNNPAGRTPGTLNKVSKDLRLSITEFLEDNFEQIVNEWNKLTGKEKLYFYKDLLKYAVPTLQATELKTDFERMTDEQLDYIIDELKKTASENDN